jgi:hypothetical protein
MTSSFINFILSKASWRCSSVILLLLSQRTL